MHLPLLKALVAVISASVLAIGVALASGGNAHHANSPATTTNASETDGLQSSGNSPRGTSSPSRR